MTSRVRHLGCDKSLGDQEQVIGYDVLDSDVMGIGDCGLEYISELKPNWLERLTKFKLVHNVQTHYPCLDRV